MVSAIMLFHTSDDGVSSPSGMLGYKRLHKESDPEGVFVYFGLHVLHQAEGVACAQAREGASGSCSTSMWLEPGLLEGDVGIRQQLRRPREASGNV